MRLDELLKAVCVIEVKVLGGYPVAQLKVRESWLRKPSKTGYVRELERLGVNRNAGYKKWPEKLDGLLKAVYEEGVEMMVGYPRVGWRLKAKQLDRLLGNDCEELDANLKLERLLKSLYVDKVEIPDGYLSVGLEEKAK